MDIRSLKTSEIEEVITLWAACGLTRAYNEPGRDIEAALAHPEADILVGNEQNQLIASAMVGSDGHRGNVYYVACHPEFQGNGYGRLMMGAAEDWLNERGVWKLNLMVRESNQDVSSFYDAIGYERQPRIVMTKWLETAPVLPRD